MINAWAEALDRAARAIERPTEDELDETLQGVYIPPDEVDSSGVCLAGLHDGCSGYTGPESDPDLCECQCHADLLEELSR